MRIIPNFKPFDFQKDAIESYTDILLKNNGVCIFDQTGLGKTITASTIALNVCKNRLLVVAARANHSNWHETLSGTDLQYDVCTVGSITNLFYDVVIVDEAHNYRSVKSKSFMNLFKTIHTQNAKAILLTATPIQNNIQELQTMISLIRFRADSPAFALLGGQFKELLETSKKLEKFKYKSRDFVPFMDGVADNFSLKDISESSDIEGIFKAQFKAVCETIATFSGQCTRDMIRLLYNEDMKLMGRFPLKQYINISYPNDSKTMINLNKTLKIIDQLKFPIHNSLSYIDPKLKNNSLNPLMKSFLLKRLDSSVAAFKASIQNLVYKIESFDWEHDCEKPQSFIDDFEMELLLLNSIQSLWFDINDDDKFSKICEAFFLGKKFVVFSEYVETVKAFNDYVIKNLVFFGPAVTYIADTPEYVLDQIENHFDANKPLPENSDFPNILIATDILSEGVNLHRADVIIHMDQKWNPSRMTQRNGRVDRLYRNTSNSHKIHIVNFTTDALIEPILGLEKVVNHKQFLDEMFWEYLKLPVFHNFNFENHDVFLFPDSERSGNYGLIKTCMGDLLISRDNYFQERTLSPVKNSEWFSELKNYVKSSKSTKEIFLYGNRLHFREYPYLSNYLYNEIFERLLSEYVKENTLLEARNKVIAEFNGELENSKLPIVCSIWLQKPKYLNWEQYF